jgi:hypothetical protein
MLPMYSITVISHDCFDYSQLPLPNSGIFSTIVASQGHLNHTKVKGELKLAQAVGEPTKPTRLVAALLHFICSCWGC